MSLWTKIVLKSLTLKTLSFQISRIKREKGKGKVDQLTQTVSLWSEKSFLSLAETVLSELKQFFASMD